jgi:dipeptidyl aminopeptidase/acylaminoacyl peptidase
MKRLTLLFTGWLLLVPATVWAQAKRPMQIDDLFRFKRVSDPQISPNGRWVAYVVAEVDTADNKIPSSIWLAAADGKTVPWRLTNAPGKKDRHPRWSPDGKEILFESNRSGAFQIWSIEIGGGEARQLTDIATEANTAIWSPDGKRIAFVSAVWPEYSDKPYKESNALNKKRQEENEKNPVKAKVFTKLFFRHWVEWVEDKRQHLFVMPATGGEPRDVTPGDHDAYPTSDTFSVGDDFTFSPDSQYLVYTAPPVEHEAWSTNYDLWRVPVAGGKAECLTRENLAADGGPKFSPDGKRLAYRAQRRAGFEADRWELMVVDTDASGAFKGSPRSVTAAFDGWPDSFVWLGNDTLIFAAEEKATAPVFTVALNGQGGTATKRITGATNGALSIAQPPVNAPAAPVKLAFTRVAMDMPAEVFISEGFNRPRNLSMANAKLLAELDLPRPESVTVPGAGGTPMQMWILKPPGFDPQKKWPLAFLVHGGPQGAWEDGWSYRWNPETWAAQGYVVALPNPRGSTGFGQKYIDEISGDWGGKCFDDLMAGLAYLEKQPYIDSDRMAAAGASFGGYMMNWFEGHTTKFKTLITHCGVYNFDSMYALTDELWFDEWEHGGTPWQKRDSYEKFSPHRFARNFRTPMLIIHNDLDFRVPVAEGLQLFSTLQRLGVPSKMINFPDEGHWVLKPANSVYWHREVFRWLAKYAPPGGR